MLSVEEFAVTEVTADDHVRGRADARVTVLEYGDYECPYCRGAARDVHEMLARYPDTVRFVFRNFPIAQLHPHAEQAAEAAEAAGAQGKFWQMYELLLQPYAELDTDSLVGYAELCGVQADRLRAAPQRAGVQFGVGLQQQLVHLPELPLGGGRLGRLGGLLRVRVELCDGEVAEHEADRV